MKLSSVKQQITKRNNIFDKASAGKKRVLIAKDVLARLITGQYKADRGFWAQISKQKSIENYDDCQSVQELLVKNEITCSCCGLGSLMLSCVAIKNQLNWGDIEYAFEDCPTFSSYSSLSKYFSNEQMKMIEIAYERGSGYYGSHAIAYEKYQKCAEFGEKYDDDDERLTAIMKNIVKNNGRFRP